MGVFEADSAGDVALKRLVMRIVRRDEPVITRRNAMVMLLRPLARWGLCDSELDSRLASSSSSLLTASYFSREAGPGSLKDDLGNENVAMMLKEDGTVDVRIWDCSESRPGNRT